MAHARVLALCGGLGLLLTVGCAVSYQTKAACLHMSALDVRVSERSCFGKPAVVKAPASPAALAVVDHAAVAVLRSLMLYGVSGSAASTPAMYKLITDVLDDGKVTAAEVERIERAETEVKPAPTTP